MEVLGILAHLLRMVMEPKYTPNIIWQGEPGSLRFRFPRNFDCWNHQTMKIGWKPNTWTKKNGPVTLYFRLSFECLLFTDWDPMGFITIKPPFGEYVWIFFQAWSKSQNIIMEKTRWFFLGKDTFDAKGLAGIVWAWSKLRVKEKDHLKRWMDRRKGFLEVVGCGKMMIKASKCSSLWNGTTRGSPLHPHM